MQIPPLKAVMTFDVVARLGSISKAAEELNLTPSAVSHQISNVEAQIGLKLFDRTARGVELTPAGERYRKSITGALTVIAAAAENARADRIEVLRIQASPSFAALWLMPRLSRFRSAHPDIKVRLSASHVHSDFARAEVDIDIRYGLKTWSDLHVEAIFTEEIIPLISPALKEQLQLSQPEDLLVENLILSNINIVQWPQWFAAQGVPISPSEYNLSFDRAYLSIQAAIQGLGIALESNRLAEDALGRGLLVPVFPYRKRVQIHGHHLVYPPSHTERGKVARFVEWIRKEV
ncbi:MAG TPA: LysR substrate-binding domain-containing protein [Casimicrobiaceae bacterium]|nr:LysR substrate-binding domain-containing protein [Casimicrobiaceae bacterium]